MIALVTQDSGPTLFEVMARLDALVVGTKELRGDTRERILDSAIQLFADEGFSGTSIRRIGASVGITPPGLYAHFQSKEEIMGVALARAYRTFLHWTFVEGRVEAEAGGEPDILQMCRRHMEFQIEYRAMSSACDQLLAKYLADQYIHPDTLAVIRDAQRVYFGRVRDAIAATRGPSPLDASLEAEAVLSLCDSISGGPRVRPVRDPAEVVQDYLHLIRRMLNLDPRR